MARSGRVSRAKTCFQGLGHPQRDKCLVQVLEGGDAITFMTLNTMEVEMLHLTRLLPLHSCRAEGQWSRGPNLHPRQWVITLWRSACRHAERPERVVPYC